MAELIVLGSSAGIPTDTRHNSSLVVKTAGKMYLIDCGCPVPAMLKRIGEEPKQIEAVFITHWHADHTSGLPIFIQDLWIRQRKERLTIYGPEGTERKVKLLQNIFILPPDIYPYDLIVKEYKEGIVFEDEHISVSAFKTGHLSQEKWKLLDEKYGNEMTPIAYGFVITCEGKKLVISGDMQHSDDMLPVLDGADLVVHEFGHFQPESINRFIREQQIRRLLLTHIHHHWDHRSDELLEAVSKGSQGEVYIAHDFMRLEL